MKHLTISLLTIAILLIPLALKAKIWCSCGEFATGIVQYQVSGPGCCSSETVSGGFVDNYIENEGVWEFSHTDLITGAQAQNRCCPPT